LKEIVWRLGVMNLTCGLIPEPLLSFIVSHLVFEEQISSRPVSGPVLGVGGEDKVVIRLLVGLFEMEVHASFWLHSGELWLFLDILNIKVELFFSVAVKNFNVESDITVIRNNTSTEWGFSSSSTPGIVGWTGESSVIAFM
jgi:hypothetical protein